MIITGDESNDFCENKYKADGGHMIKLYENHKDNMIALYENHGDSLMIVHENYIPNCR